MFSLINAEIKKSCLKLPIFLLWGFALLLGMVVVKATGSVADVYADLFYKFFGIAPILGMLMFLMFSGSYIKEYNTGMFSLINTTKKGKKNTVTAKWMAHGIMASIMNLSIYGMVVYRALSKTGFKELDMSIQQLWFFKEGSYDLSVLQLILIMAVTLIIGSFIFAQIGLALAATSKSAMKPFFLGGLIMGLPYLLNIHLKSLGLTDIAVLTPTFGMFYSQEAKFGAPMFATIFLIVLTIACMVILPKIAYRAFTNENRK